MIKKIGPKHILVLGFGLALSLLMWGALTSLEDRLNPDESMWGIFQSDMPNYLANARSTSSRTLHLTYSSPYDLGEQKDAYLIQLPITLLSLLQKTGLSDSKINLLLTLLFGPFMFYGLYVLLEFLISNVWVRVLAFFTISVGGGVAWLNALVKPYVDLWSGIRFFEKYYYFWFFNLFRNLMYPFELIYHVVFFAYLFHLMKKEWKVANMLLILAMLMNPFLSLQMISVHLVCTFLDRETAWKSKLISLPAIILWAVYYQFLLPLSPVFKSLIDQHSTAFQKPQQVKDFFQAYGVASLALLTLFDKKFFQKIREEWKLVPIIVLAFVTLGLLHHTRIPFLPKLQPMHFERGYLYSALFMVLFSWIAFGQDIQRLSQNFVKGLTIFLLLISLPDNIAFLRDQIVLKPTVPLMIWKKDRDRLFDYIGQLEPHQHILIPDMNLSLQVGAKFDQQVFFGTHFTTPNYREREKNVVDFLQNQGSAERSPIIQKWGIDYLILHVTELEKYSINPSLWSKNFEVGEWSIYRKKN